MYSRTPLWASDEPGATRWCRRRGAYVNICMTSFSFSPHQPSTVFLSRPFASSPRGDKVGGGDECVLAFHVFL